MSERMTDERLAEIEKRLSKTAKLGFTLYGHELLLALKAEREMVKYLRGCQRRLALERDLEKEKIAELEAKLKCKKVAHSPTSDLNERRYSGRIERAMTEQAELMAAMEKDASDSLFVIKQQSKRIKELKANLKRVEGLPGPESFPFDRSMSKVHYAAYKAGYNHGRNDAAVEREIALKEKDDGTIQER